MTSLVFWALLALPQTQGAEAEGLAVPRGPAIDLDGKLEAEEWKDARREPLAGGGELLLLQDEQHVYLGLRGTGEGWTHVYLEDGETVVVRHASAALGTARYCRDDLGKWQPVQAFPVGDAWALRDPSLMPEARARRAEYLAKEGWVASNNSMQKSECELVLTRKGLGERPRLAVVFVADPKKPLLWPATLADACAHAPLLAGTTPPDLAFEPATWGRLRLALPAPTK